VRGDGRAFLIAAAVYAIGRIVVEELRGDAGRGIYLGLSSGQIFSLLVLAAIAAGLGLGRIPPGPQGPSGRRRGDDRRRRARPRARGLARRGRARAAHRAAGSCAQWTSAESAIRPAAAARAAGSCARWTSTEPAVRPAAAPRAAGSCAQWTSAESAVRPAAAPRAATARRNPAGGGATRATAVHAHHDPGAARGPR